MSDAQDRAKFSDIRDLPGRWDSPTYALIAAAFVDAILDKVHQGKRPELRDHMLGVCAKVSRSFGGPPWMDAHLAAAEQRGREDNERHEMCYVDGSRALAEHDRRVGARVLRDLPLSLVEYVRSSGRAQVLIARDAGITEKHLSQMLNHKAGSITAWVKVIHAVERAGRMAGEGT